MNICILSGAPIQSGDGVGDFSFLLAENLKSHHNVTLLAPNADRVQSDFAIYGIPGGWGIRGCLETYKLIQKLKPQTVLVQFVPQLYGLKGANPFFSALLRKLNRKGYDVVTVAHEFSSPLASNPKTMALGAAHRMLFRSVVNASSKIISTTPFCLNLLQERFNTKSSAFHYIPVSSTIIPFPVNDQTKAKLRSDLNLAPENFVVATFGSIVGGGLIYFKTFLNWLVKENPLARFIFLGKGSGLLKQEFSTDIQQSIHATGQISDQAITQYLSIANLYAVFYPDGASTRRTSLMTGLAHGIPTVSNLGILTDSSLIASKAVFLLKDCSVEELTGLKKSIDDKRILENMGHHGRSYFDKNLSWSKVTTEYCRLLNGSSQ